MKPWRAGESADSEVEWPGIPTTGRRPWTKTAWGEVPQDPSTLVGSGGVQGLHAPQAEPRQGDAARRFGKRAPSPVGGRRI